MKTCMECQETKSLSSYYSNKTYPDGYESRCKACRKFQRADNIARGEPPKKRKLSSKKWSEGKKRAFKKKRLEEEIDALSQEIRERVVEGKLFEATTANNLRDKLRKQLKLLQPKK